MTARTAALAALLCLAALGGCRSQGGAGAGAATAGRAARVTGRVRADRIPADGTIEVYRDAGGGPAVPVAGAGGRLDGLGRFETGHLLPGRYLVVLRTREGPPSVASVDVPGRTEVEMRIATPTGGSAVTLVGPAKGAARRTCRLVPAVPQGPVPDRREVVVAPGAEVRVDGLAPGLWHVDVLPDGATADLEVPAGESVPRFLLDVPDAPGGTGVLEGTVLRGGGEPAFGAAVTVRTTADHGMTVQSWGRLALVDRDGRFRVERLPAGDVYVRVEGRDARFVALPPAELVTISPSAPAHRAYVVRP